MKSAKERDRKNAADQAAYRRRQREGSRVAITQWLEKSVHEQLIAIAAHYGITNKEALSLAIKEKAQAIERERKKE